MKQFRASALSPKIEKKMAPNEGATKPPHDNAAFDEVSNGGAMDHPNRASIGEFIGHPIIKRRNDCGCVKECSDAVNRALETFWYKIGYFIGCHPYVTIFVSVFASCVFVIGIVKFDEETDASKLWVARNSDIIWQQEWVTKNFPSRMRIQQILMKAPEDGNILTSASIDTMIDIVDEIKNVSANSVRSESIKKDFGFLGCEALPDLWMSQRSIINSLTETQIAEKVGANQMFKNMIGDIKYDGDNIQRAGAASITCALLSEKELGDNSVTGLNVWEENFVGLFNKSGRAESFGMERLYIYNTWAQTRDFAASIQSDLTMLFAGFVIIIIFVMIVLGEFNRLGHRLWMALMSVAAVGFAIGGCYGMSSAFGVIYGPVHTILPFLMLGIGIDDAFIIAQAWDNLRPKFRASIKISDQMGEVMRQAGVSVMVTSLTNFAVFVITSTSILPALSSFCIFASIGILWLFFMQTTFFAAFLSFDIRRKLQQRDACVPCLVLSNSYQPNACSQMSLMNKFFEEVFARVVLHKVAKPFFILLTFGLLAGGIYGILHIEQDFDPIRYLPSDSPTVQFILARDEFFPSDGERAYVYLADIDYIENQHRILQLTKELRKSEEVKLGTVESWFSSLHAWNGFRDFIDAESFCQNLTDFTRSQEWRKFSDDVKIAKDNCTVVASRLRFQHRTYKFSVQQIDAKNEMNRIVREVLEFEQEKAFPFGENYRNWETMEVIAEELLRNCLLALLCVLLVTLLLIASPLMCFYVVASVLFTIVDVGGAFFYWGLSIETTTAACMTLAVGLCIDYAAHIGNAFMTVKGSRDHRARQTLTLIGPAVFNGGFSTFLAFVLLSGSNSYIFQTFFKVFFSVVVFGLFHALIFLPVVLSYIGPAPHDAARGPEDVNYRPEDASRRPSDAAEAKDGVHNAPPRKSANAVVPMAETFH